MLNEIAPEQEVTCGPLVAGGDALVRREGEKVLFVDGGIPGETVKVAIRNERRDLANGEVVAVVEPSPHRIVPPCKFFRAGCGGCQWQHIEFPAQGEYKLGIVRDSLARIAKRPDAPISFGGAVDSFGYRTTMRFHVEDGLLGLYKRRSDELVMISNEACPISHPLLIDLIRGSSFPHATEVTLRASVSTGERLAFVKGDAAEARVPDDVIVTTDGRNAAIHEEVLGRRYQISARSFFQSGPEAAALLASTVDSFVPEDADWVVDAYAGVGVLAGTVGERLDCQLTLVEQSKSAVHDARNNLADLSAEIIEAEVAKVSLPGSESPDVVIADPARPGLGPSATRALTALGAPTMILVSCDPASLARDVNLLDQSGYDLEEIVVLDLFPQTHHVEAVSVFTAR